jgi:hypothetical protein
VVGNSDTVYPKFQAAADNLFQRRVAVHGVPGVDMKVGF